MAAPFFEHSLDATLAAAGLDFLDPWGNRVQVVQYRERPFTKAPQALKGTGLDGLEKSVTALQERAAKEIALEEIL